MTPLCIYHADCADGLGAAWAVRRALGPDVEFVAAKYGDLPPRMKWVADNNHCRDCDRAYEMRQSSPSGHPSRLESTPLPSRIAGRDILIMDFSYPLPVLRAMAAEARSVLVLDHHKTAAQDLEQIQSVHPDTFRFDEWTRRDGTSLAAIFDLNRSGTGLAWDYLGASPRPRIIDLIEDRDLWRFAYGDETRAFHAVLASYDWTDLPGMFRRLDRWRVHSESGPPFAASWPSLLAEGHAILRAQRIAVAAAVAASRRTIRIAGATVPVANVPRSMASEAGHLLCQSVDIEKSEPGVLRMGHNGTPLFSATYYDGPSRRHFSLRSPEGGADVGAIARAIAAGFSERAKAAGLNMSFTGGGHPHAAGFDAPLGWEGDS